MGHAFFVDDTGHKLSKSKGNIIDPREIYEKYGADVLRMWFTYADFRRKMYAAESIYEQVADAYRKIRFTCRFMLQNLADFDPTEDAVPYAEMLEVDRWALTRLAWLTDRMTKAFDEWNLHLFYHEVHGFCVTDLSAFYLNVLKDRLYTELPDSRVRRSAQTALWEILMALVRLIAPVMTFTAEEIWQHCRKLHASLPASVQEAYWPEARPEWRDEGLTARWEVLLQVRDGVLSALERLKRNGVCENPIEAAVEVEAEDDVLQTLAASSENGLHALFGVSSVELRPYAPPRSVPEKEAAFIAMEATFGRFNTVARRGDGAKCERCWMRLPSVGDDTDHPALCSRCAGHVRALGV